MKKFRWQLLILFLTGLVVGTLLILEKRGGIGQNGGLQPVSGGVYTEALVGSLKRLNPLLDSSNQVDRDVDRLIYSGILKFDSRGLAVPDLANSVTVSQDGVIYSVQLKDKLEWHDGEPLTTADVAFTIDLMKSGDGFIAQDLIDFWKAIKVVVLDERNMQFVLPEAFSPFQDYLAFGILPEHILGEKTISEISDSDFNLSPIGSGPYQFSEITVEDSIITGITLKGFDQYAGTPPFIQEIVFRYYPNAQTAYQAYLDGFVQGVSEIPNNLLPAALVQPTLSIYSGRLPQISMILLNLNDPGVPFFQVAEIREALLLGLNRQRLVNDVFNGQAIVANGVIFPESWAYMDGLATVNYDLDQAILLLKQSGYVVTGEEEPVRTKDNTVFKFVLSYPDDELHRKLAESIQADWKKLSLDVTLEPIPADVFVSEKLAPRAFQAALVDLNLGSTPDPDPYPFWDLGQAATGQNYSQWNNRLASDSIEQARVTTDFSERTRLYHNFQSIFAQELPSLPLYFPVYNYAVDSSFKGVSMGPLIDTSYRFASVTSWFLTTRSAQADASSNGK
ncbi:MAG: peptide ABC transporter substrate-binding protein [Chloroflexi bacterium]|nr:peptide ABC transporter substrate-binding protein [Chloroflexota bacterium]